MIRISGDLFGVSATAVIAVLCLVAAGCNKTQSSQQALEAQLQTLHMQKEPLGPFAGKVTVDSLPPKTARGKAFVVILYDPKNPEQRQHYAVCGKDGSFAFYTNTAGDGVRQGSYVVLFDELTATRRGGLLGPDGLKNLYNDPDKNAQNKDFVVTVDAHGKTDYDFNLQIAGKEPGTPGPHAVKEIRKN